MGTLILIGALILIALILLIVCVLDTNRFRVVTYRVKTGILKSPVRLVFISDLHDKQYGKENEKLLAAIEAQKPDLVLIGGDLMTAHPGNGPERALSFTKKLCEKYPVYFGSGNHEQRLQLYPERYPGVGEALENGLQKMGVVRLKNETSSCEAFPLQISSVEIDRSFYRRGRALSMSREDMLRMIEPPAGDGYRVLLAHNPDYFSAYRAWGADLVLAGHVHGGIMRLPVLGGVVSPRIRLFPKYDGGRFDEEGAVMIVSRGLGSHTIPVRIFNPGELDVIILE